MEQPEVPDRHFQFLVFGIDRKGLTLPEQPIQTRNCTISFAQFETEQRFQEFDGVILFKGIFEHFETRQGWDRSYLVHSCEWDELDKRKKEAALLHRKGGFLCFLLSDRFIDAGDHGGDFRGGDLAKYHLNYSDLYRKNFSTRVTHLEVKVDGFRKFLDLYGAASSYFVHHNKLFDCRTIAEFNGEVVSMVISKQDYFLPTLVPSNRADEVTNYFTHLADALVSSWTKLLQDLPEWINAFSFDEEKDLLHDREIASARMKDIDNQMECLKRYKSVLALSSEELTDGVIDVFRDGFGIAVDATDELREDLKLLNSDKKPFLLCEVKSTNRGVSREHVNQVDSHRERSKFDPMFPSLLIINTGVKKARSVAEKDEKIAREQIQHASRMNVLIMRTLDLLFLLRQFRAGVISRDEVVRILTTNAGWLCVNESKWWVVKGDESEPSS